VHDPGAAMLGGVGGHAGVFSDAFDLGAMMQMFLNDGSYNGTQYISKNTIDYFTHAHFAEDHIRRGVGFDKPDPSPGVGPTCDEASLMSFGHSGFTGTLAWADPANGLVYVFLSNRVYPNAENKKLLKMNIRTDIQHVLYEALRKAQERNNALEVFPDWKAQR
ncbi:MAG: serine hydrolase, partial [Flavobacteriales bacterium]|nr:serine hydrolase [Flavobacteriales bacterium]